MTNAMFRRVGMLSLIAGWSSTVGCLTGCVTTDVSNDPIIKHGDKHSIVGGQDAGRLTNGYEFKQVLDGRRILLLDKDGQFEVVLRGCKLTDDDVIDTEAMGTLVKLWDDKVYLLKDSIVDLGNRKLKAVIYRPTTQFCTGKDEKSGELQYYVANYAMVQIWMLLEGETILDRTDTDYPLYKVFLEAENLARKYNMGYWATHGE